MARSARGPFSAHSWGRDGKKENSHMSWPHPGALLDTEVLCGGEATVHASFAWGALRRADLCLVTGSHPPHIPQDSVSTSRQSLRGYYEDEYDAVCQWAPSPDSQQAVKCPASLLCGHFSLCKSCTIKCMQKARPKIRICDSNYCNHPDTP